MNNSGEKNGNGNGQNKSPFEILISKLKGLVDQSTQTLWIKDFLEGHEEVKGTYFKLTERRTVTICIDSFCKDKKTVCEHHLQFIVNEENFRLHRFFCLEDNEKVLKYL